LYESKNKEGNKMNIKSLKKAVLFALIGLFISAGVFAKTIPAVVKESFSKKFPNVTRVKWDKENAHEYEASFKLNEIKYSANFSDNGEWLETETGTTFDKLPQKVQDSFNANYKGHTVKAVSSIETSKGITKYEIEYKKGKKTVELFYDENGNPVKE
jgi:Putative beta-lactamase-inhibitor-like, PepSY-like